MLVRVGYSAGQSSSVQGEHCLFAMVAHGVENGGHGLVERELRECSNVYCVNYKTLTKEQQETVNTNNNSEPTFSGSVMPSIRAAF